MTDIPRPCRHGGCMTLTTNGYCDKHIGDMRKVRTSAAKRGYGHKWQKARITFLTEHPFCAECGKQGRKIPATEVDHIIPHKGNQKLFWDTLNWQALCHSCHSRKTAREDGGAWVPPSPFNN